MITNKLHYVVHLVRMNRMIILEKPRYAINVQMLYDLS